MQKNLPLFAKRLKQARLTAHISQIDLGKALGLSDKSISAYESGRLTPTEENFKKIAELTNRPISYFYEEDLHKANMESKKAIEQKEWADLRKMLNLNPKD